LKKTDGFSLVELVVGILATALVSGAVMTFMLMGFRTNRAVLDANTNQRNARIVISLLEKLASEGNIDTLKITGEVEFDPETETVVDAGDRSWSLRAKDGSDLLSYSPSEKTIYSNGAPLMEGVLSSAFSLSPSDLGGCLLGFSLQTDESFYVTSVYNRLSKIQTDGVILDKNNFQVIIPSTDPELESPPIDLTESTEAKRLAFLEVLLSQYGSGGTIIQNGKSTNIPYSLWYCGGTYLPGWNADTPWCACFASWAMAQISDSLETVPREADVDELLPLVQTISSSTPSSVKPGDLIFFNWDDDSELEHVGVVLFMEAGYVYTIEGNSGGQVALRRYPTNSSSIHRYGVLAWK